MKAYTFRVQVRWSEPVWRIVEVTDDFTLEDLHLSIQNAFDWDNDHLYAFFMSGRPWDAESMYRDPRGGGSILRNFSGRPTPRRADETLIAALGIKPGKKFLYIFDFGDEWHHEIELMNIVDADPTVRYPRIVESFGESPEQYPSCDEDDDDDTTPAESRNAALGELAELVQKIRKVSDIRTETLGREDLEKHYLFAMELSESIRKHAVAVSTPDASETYDLLDEAVGSGRMFDWLISLPFALARQNMIREATVSARAWADIADPEIFLGDLAVLLAQARLDKDARDQIDENLARFPNDIWIRIKAADAYRHLEELDVAEMHYRGSLKMADDDYDRAGVMERLIPLLRQTGKADEARELEADERRREAAERADWNRAERRGHKVGRNTPCPCGSGKKFKKCCLNAESAGLSQI